MGFATAKLCVAEGLVDLAPNPDEYRWWFICDEGKGKKAAI